MQIQITRQREFLVTLFTRHYISAEASHNNSGKRYQWVHTSEGTSAWSFSLSLWTLLKTHSRSEMAKKEQAAVVECAQQLRKIGDLLDWKYKLLELIIALQRMQNDGKSWKRRNPNTRTPDIWRWFNSEDVVRRLPKTQKVEQEWTSGTKTRRGWPARTSKHGGPFLCYSETIESNRRARLQLDFFS